MMSRAAPLMVMLLLLLLLLGVLQPGAGVPGPVSATAASAPLESSGADPCRAQPCQNNGTCSPVLAKLPAVPHRLPLLFLQPQPAYTCACPPGVSGAECQIPSVALRRYTTGGGVGARALRGPPFLGVCVASSVSLSGRTRRHGREDPCVSPITAEIGETEGEDDGLSGPG
ncbi:hypothetical protein JRQ81_017862 [Phrynocephalus forsythii]|uniref:EGF-like domain-containing protein n=1 Tax=Phrynocephalus forsythii TaxID=171643 RepID=A0A9Q0XS65_9SAUR|nr:hypothetical protein JRQ81_017862 [Phrynocephalus forsythii]